MSETKKEYFEPADLADYYKVYEHGHRRATSFNLYDTSQLHAMCEQKNRELIELDLFRSQIEDSIVINEGDDWLVNIQKKTLEQVEKAQKEGYTYAIYNPEFSENGITFIEGSTLEELLHSVSCNAYALDLRDIEYEPRSTTDIYLSVPVGQEDQVRSLGAEFDEDETRWYIPADTNLQPFENWLYEEQVIDNTPSMN